MKVTEFHTEDYPVEERFGLWHDLVGSSLAPSVVRSERPECFRASVRLLHLGAVQVSGVTCLSSENSRTPKLIRTFDPESYQLLLNLRGGHRIIHVGRDATVGPGEVMLTDASRPWRLWVRADTETAAAEGMVLNVPKALLPLPPNRLAELVAVPLPGREGVGALLSGYLTQLLRDATTYQPGDSARLAALTVDLLTAQLAHHLDAETQVPPETHHEILRRRIRHFIERRLGDPALSPNMIAAAHQISARQLYTLFREQGLPVATWIRRRRLEHCHVDLADPRLFSRPVHAIAARWGFTDNAHFSRVFRTAYGISPKEHRGLARHGHRVRVSSTTAQ
ncbi:helix-turn-helix domain-containing protein [Streptomyces sp. NPDC094034]|uniref:AraC-like ligand-binding domain-containing protein n=1 Tax=Streptomyces sp. NPDC094034 TaxID=3155309 RepID=UPI00331E2D12